MDGSDRHSSILVFNLKRPHLFIAKTAHLIIFSYSSEDTYIMCDVLLFKICPVNLYIVYVYMLILHWTTTNLYTMYMYRPFYS